MGTNKAVLILVSVFLLLFGQAFAQSDEARRHFDRGMVAVEMAKAPEDLEIAIKEFKQAATLAPDWPDAFFNLGKVQETAQKYPDAIASFRRYLVLAPNAADAADVKSAINKLEYKAENVMTAAKAVSVLGQVSTWNAKGGSGFHAYIRGKGPTTVEVPSSVLLWGSQRELKKDIFRRELVLTGPKLSFHYTLVLMDNKNVANYSVDVDVEMEVVSLSKVKVRELAVWRYWYIGGDPVTRISVYDLVP